MIQTLEKEGWYVSAKDFKINDRTMENVPQILRTLISPQFQFLYMTVNQWHLFWNELKDVSDEDIKFPKLKDDPEYMKCKDKNYCYFEKQCDKVIEENGLKGKYLHLLLSGISGTNQVKGTFDKSTGYDDYTFRIYWEDVLADSGQFGVDQGFCYITVFPSGSMETVKSKEIDTKDKKDEDKKEEDKKEEEKKIVVQANEPAKINADMIIGERFLEDKYLVFDARPAEAGYEWNQIGFAYLDNDFKVGSSVYDESSQNFDKAEAAQDSSVQGETDTFWSKNKMWIIIVGCVVFVGLVAVIGLGIKKKREQQTFYSQV